MSDEELEAELQHENPDPEAGAKVTYHGEERRSGEDRRSGPADRRAMVRFEPEKGQTDPFAANCQLPTANFARRATHRSIE
ncbi:MAG: hypothetical protein P8009_08255 [Gammaproteobacteria bacterium]